MSGSVEDFRRFAELFPEPILLVSSSARLCALNTSAASAVFANRGLEPEQDLLALLQEAPEKVIEYLRACSRSAQPLPGVLTFRSGPARAVAFRAHGSAFRARDAQQRPMVVLRLLAKDAASRFIALNQQIEQLKKEISRRLKAERTVQEQRELLQVTLSSIGDAVIATDLQGRITFMNPIAADHLGQREEECRGRALEEVFVIRNELTGEPVENPVQKVLRTGDAIGLANHTVLIRPDGGTVPIDDSAAPIRDCVGNIFGVILVFHEVGESRRLQQELMRQTAALKEADRRKDEFMAVLAHELRNPLAPLRNGLQLARLKARSDDSLTHTVEMMERQLLHLVRLVNDLMDVNRASRGVIELRRAPVNLQDVLARSAESAQADMQARGHAFQMQVCAQPVVVLGDADRLVQVFSNLLGNSAKYSPDESLIRLELTQEGAEAVVRVVDSGIGIPAEQLERVFEIFSQVRAHQGRAEGGLGIGLSLVRTLVAMHRGSVQAQSEGIGTGSTFTVRLPVSAQPAQSAAVAPLAPRQSRRPVRILVADDNIDSANSLRSLLELEGHLVRTAATGREALQEVAAFEPALVFMDLGMPEMDGLETTRLIRQRARGNEIVVVALTGWGQPQDRERTRLAGVDRHLVKPIDPDDLAAAIALAEAKSI